MVIDDKFYVGGARDRQIIRMVRGIRRFHKVYELNELRQKVYRDMENSIHIVGAAPSRVQAIWLVRDIIDDIYRKTGDVDVKGFFDAEV